MGLQIFWYTVIAFFWTGFFILEGFDLGVGALHMSVGRSDVERRVAINTIGPFWDGNEVWLIVAGAGTFAAFPYWYATMFSGMYLALMVVILALIARGVSFEYRGKVGSNRWHSVWDWSMTVASLIIPLVLGIALGDLVHGLPINQKGEYTGSFWDLFTGYGVWTGITLLAISLAHGAMYLSLKADGQVEQRSRKVAAPLAWAAALAVVGFVIWTHVQSSQGVLASPLQILAMLLAIGAAWFIRDGSAGWGFAATTATMASVLTSIFVTLYPNVMVSSTNKAYNLTVAGTASSSYALTVMTVVAAIFAPLVLAYQGWSYYVFRGRVRTPVEPAQTEVPSAP